jgi:glutathione S-transferase
MPYNAAMITVHHLNDSRSQRVLWLLEELEVPYQIQYYERDSKTMLAPPALRAIHPLGKSPVIVDGVITVAESGAIIEYLVEQYGRGRMIPPAGTPQRLRYTYWLHYAEGSAMPPLLMKFLVDRVTAARVIWPIGVIARRIARSVQTSFIGPQLARHFDYMEAELDSHIWFAGEEFTAADVQMSFPLEVARSRAVLKADRPKLTAFLARIHARAAYQRALKRGGPCELTGEVSSSTK